MTPIACNCQQCRAMCRASTCLGTPEDVLRLVAAGYGDRLAAYRFPSGSAIGAAPVGRSGEHLTTTQAGPCTFYSEAGGCALHGAGLKPTEGRLAHHDRPWLGVRQEVMRHWSRTEFRNLSRLLKAGN